jgi:malate synthase
MGGMAAFIPSRRDPEVNAVALAKVREDKAREAGDGFDGSWVARPDLVPACREVFDSVLRNNISVALQYLAACGPLVTKDVVERMIDEELGKIHELTGEGFDTARYGQAVALLTEVALADSFAEFLTLPAYERMP